MTELAVSVVQSNPLPGDLAGAVRNHARLAIHAAQQGARLALFPELSLTGYNLGLTRADALTPDDTRLEMLQQVADAHEIVIVAGAPVESASGLQIGALCFRPRQRAVIYTKRFLHEGEDQMFAPGVGGEVLALRDYIIGIAICAEITHPEHASEAARAGADVYAASCFITPSGYAHDSSLLGRYAREHRMTVLMANFGAGNGTWDSAGRSAIWSRNGDLLIQGPPAGEAVLVAKISGDDRADDDGESSSPVCYLHEFESSGQESLKK